MQLWLEQQHIVEDMQDKCFGAMNLCWLKLGRHTSGPCLHASAHVQALIAEHGKCLVALASFYNTEFLNTVKDVACLAHKLSKVLFKPLEEQCTFQPAHKELCWEVMHFNIQGIGSALHATWPELNARFSNHPMLVTCFLVSPAVCIVQEHCLALLVCLYPGMWLLNVRLQCNAFYTPWAKDKPQK